MSIIFSIDTPPTGFPLVDFSTIEDIVQVVGVIENGDATCSGDGANVTALANGNHQVDGCTAGAFNVTFVLGEQYRLMIEGDAPVVSTIYDIGGTLPDTFTFMGELFSDDFGSLAFPSFYSPDLGLVDCDIFLSGGACDVVLYVGAGDGEFGSFSIEHVERAVANLPEPSMAFLLGAALLGTAVLRRVKGR